MNKTHLINVKMFVKRGSIVLLFMIVCKLTFAQFGPGGVGNSTNNGLWLKADDISQATGTAVASWSDASGNGNNAAQTTVALQPNYFSTSSMNGMPIVRLDGANDQLIVPDANILDDSPGMTLYAAIRPNNLNGAPRGIMGKRITFTNPSEYAYTWFFWTNNRLYLDINTSNDRFNTAATFSNATNYILGATFDGSLPQAQRSYIRNESNILTTSGENSTAITNSNQDVAIGALNVNYGTYLGADYGDLIHFNYTLNNLEHLLVQNYLSAKYNIALSSNDLYDEDNPANGNYDYDVAGIGRIDASTIHNDSKGSGIVRIQSPTDLNDLEFLIWGHDNGAQNASEVVDVPAGIAARFERVWRVSEVNSSQASVDVGAINIRFDLTGNGPVTASDLRLLVDTDNDGLFADETGITGASPLGGNVYQFSGVTAIENNLRFTLATINQNQTPLPTELVSFDVKTTNSKDALLKWQTATEINNSHFSLERSLDGVQWKEFEQVQGAGNSSTINHYSLVDTSPGKGTFFYRLKQVDFDGSFTYSKARSVYLKPTVNTVSLYPNPAQDVVTIKGDLEELRQLEVFSSTGQRVSEFITIQGNSDREQQIDLSRLSVGIYWIKTTTQVLKVVKE